MAALEAAWAEIRQRHPDVPPAVLITGSGAHGARLIKLGHFAASRWTFGEDGKAALGEVFIGGEGLARGARPVLATLLHEAAHALAHVHEVKDVSRQGRYHNQRFKALAQELGLELAYDPRLGWSPSTLPASTARRYETAISGLARALGFYRAPEATPAQRGRGTLSVCVCECGRLIRISPGVLAQGPVLCGGVCEAPFKPRGQQ